MSAIKHIDYQGRTILYIDLEGSASDFEIIDLGEKAKKLVKISSRTEQFVMYNLAGVTFTRNLMQHLKGLMEHAPLVSRRVVFGIDARYTGLVQQVMISLKLTEKTRYADTYPQAVNLITNDSEWGERRRNPPVPPRNGQERRTDPSKALPGSDLQDQFDKMFGS